MKRSNVLSISLRPELAELVRSEAAESDRPVSRVVSEAVSTWAAGKKEQHENG